MSAARLLAAMLDLFVTATPGLTDAQRARLQAAYETLVEFDTSPQEADPCAH